MNSTVKYCLVTKDNYAAFYSLTQQQVQGPMLLPIHWLDCLWGVLAYSENEELLGGWVGRKRLSGWKARLYQEIVFDSMPQIFSANVQQLAADSDLFNSLIDETLRQGKQEQIAAFVVTHWSRTKFDYLSPEFIAEDNATFLNNLQCADSLQFTEGVLLSQVVSKQRNIIRKAQKLGVTISSYTSQQALLHLTDFQRLRTATQERAISNNKHASMLLKSDGFFTDILLNYSSTLYIASFKGKTAACALMMHSGGTTYYYSGGSDHELNRQSGASALLIHEAMLDAANHGIYLFDMGGVPVCPTHDHPAYGVYKFKQSYGGEYDENKSGTFVLNRTKYFVLKQLKQHRKLLRIISKSM